MKGQISALRICATHYRERLSMKTQRGFTLLELMITLVIVAVLTAIALPNYTNYVTRGNIPEATSNLAAMRVQMEQYFQDNRTYLNAPTCITPPSGKNFTFTCQTPLSASHYTLQAQGQGPMAGFTYTVNDGNNQASTIAPPAPAAWIGSNNSCWITKPGGVC